jgi:DNA anti-recombination protein RmuC
MNWKQRLGVKMETKKPRALEEIQQEFNGVCAYYGSAHFRLAAIQKDYHRAISELKTQMQTHSQRLSELSTEAEQVRRAQPPLEAPSNEASVEPEVVV